MSAIDRPARASHGQEKRKASTSSMQGNTRLQKFKALGSWIWTHVLSAQSTNPGGLAVAGTSIFSAEPEPRRITTFSTLDGMQAGQFAVGSPSTFPYSVAVESGGNLLVARSSSSSSSIIRYTAAGTFLGTFVDVPGYLSPSLAVAPDGTVVVAFQQPVEIRRYSALGELLAAWTPSVAGVRQTGATPKTIVSALAVR